MGNFCEGCKKSEDGAEEAKPVQKITIINERWQGSVVFIQWPLAAQWGSGLSKINENIHVLSEVGYRNGRTIVVSCAPVSFRVHKQLGKGGCGKVYEVFDITDNNKPYAMKTEAVKNTETGRLPQEEKVISLIHERGFGRHVTELLDRGMLQMDPRRPPTQFIVMTLLGPSLADLRKVCKNKKMTPGTTALLAIQMLESVEDIHACGYIHRDIKPGNYMLGAGPRRHLVYLIDFGMARKFMDDEGKLLPIRKDNVRFRGTFRYAASETHKNVEYGRQHDLSCLMHTLVELRMGELPWQEFEGDPTATFELKHKIIPMRWLSTIEPQYLAFFEHLTSLHYDIKPGYEMMRGLFREILKNLKMTPESPFEWEPGGENYNRFSKKDLTKMFRDDIKT